MYVSMRQASRAPVLASSPLFHANLTPTVRQTHANPSSILSALRVSPLPPCVFIFTLSSQISVLSVRLRSARCSDAFCLWSVGICNDFLKKKFGGKKLKWYSEFFEWLSAFFLWRAHEDWRLREDWSQGMEEKVNSGGREVDRAALRRLRDSNPWVFWAPIWSPCDGFAGIANLRRVWMRFYVMHTLLRLLEVNWKTRISLEACFPLFGRRLWKPESVLIKWRLPSAISSFRLSVESLQSLEELWRGFRMITKRQRMRGTKRGNLFCKKLISRVLSWERHNGAPSCNRWRDWVAT